MDNPRLDTINLNYDDMLAPKRRHEIRLCIDRLKRFKPTKVGVEQATEQEAALNEAYRQYRAGTFDLGRSEIYQLGFRIA